MSGADYNKGSRKHRAGGEDFGVKKTKDEAPSGPARGRLRDRLQSFYADRTLLGLLVAVVCINFLAMPKNFYRGDPIAVQEDVRTLLTHGNFAVDPQVAAQFGENGQYFVKNESTGGIHSKYGFANLVMFIPPLLVEYVLHGELPFISSPSRTFWLDMYYVFLSAILASLLYAITARYSESRGRRVLFVLASFYGTFWWNYLRGQTFEMFQLLFFLSFALSFYRWRDTEEAGAPSTRAYLAAWAWVAVLSHTRIVYVLLGPVLFLETWRVLAKKAAAGDALVAALKKSVAPGVAVLALLGLVNFLKFGSPFLTGYHVWKPEIHGLNGDYADSLYGLLFSAHWSVFIHFPMLIMALWGMGEFYKKHRDDAIFTGLTALTFYLVIGKLSSWRGEACYGPRYFLFVLPLLAMPALLAWKNWGETFKAGWESKALVVLSVLMMSYSAWLQHWVNRYDFIHFYGLRDPLNARQHLGVGIWFQTRHYGRVNWDLYRVVEDGDWNRLDFWEELAKIVPPEFIAQYKAHVTQAMGTSNYYWF